MKYIFTLLLNVNVFTSKISLTVSLFCRVKLLPEVPSPVIDTTEFRCPEEQVSKNKLLENRNL